MLKLPVCPYCHTVYYYGEIAKITKYKRMECYHCKKKFRVIKWKGRIIFYLLFILLIGSADLLFLSVTDMKTAKPMIVFTVICVILSLFLLPFTVRFKSLMSQEKQKRKK